MVTHIVYVLFGDSSSIPLVEAHIQLGPDSKLHFNQVMMKKAIKNALHQFLFCCSLTYIFYRAKEEENNLVWLSALVVTK